MIRLTQTALNNLFINDVKPFAVNISCIEHKPIVFDMIYPFSCHVKAYVFNCTAPPGGRTVDEWKIQLILDNQKRNQRGKFDDSDGSVILIVGYAIPMKDPMDGVWILFELDKHRTFAYSANIQIYLRQILNTLTQDIYVYQKHNMETVVLAGRPHLIEAIRKRMDIDLQVLLSKAT